MKEKLHIASISSGYRAIQDGRKFDAFFPKPDSRDRIIIEDGEVEDTVELMKRVVWRYLDDTKKIAPILKGSTIKETAENIWNFLYHHIQYRLDKKGLEQLRRPARSWAERKSGIDCDCFSIFASSILTNLQIPHFFRIAQYEADYFQHVYVVVSDGNKQWIIDPVLSAFNYEKPYTRKKDFTMSLQGMDVAVLSGHANDLPASLWGILENTEFVEDSPADAMDAMYDYLVSTRAAISRNPEMIRPVEDPDSFLQMLDYALEYWYTDKRDKALEVLSQNEALWNKSQGLSSAYSEDESLGGLKNFFSNVKDFVAKTAAGAKELAQKVGKGVIRYNPFTAVARIGLLAALKLNLKRIASKLKWAYASQAQAAAKGISREKWTKAKVALTKIEKLYADRMQGKREALRDAILKGRAGGLNGELGNDAQLGEPVTVATSIAAATPVIVAVIKIIQDAGLFEKGEDTSTSNLVKEAEALAKSANIPLLLEDEITKTVQNTMLKPSVIERILSTNPGLAPSATSHVSPGILPTSSSSPSRSSGQASSFIANNKGLVIAAVAVLGVGGYLLLRKSKRRTSLSGTSRKRSTRTVRTGTAKRTGRRRIKKLNLK